MAREYQTIEAGGELRVLSCHERTMPVGDPRCCSGIVGVGNAPALIARKDWPKCIDLSVITTEILDQDGLSLCHSFMGCGLMEDAVHLAGRKDEQFSAGFLAGKVTGGVNTGAGIDEVMEALLKYGICLRSTVAQNDYHDRYSQAAIDEAIQHRLFDAWDCGHDDVFDGAVSNLIYENPVGIGSMAFGGGHAIRKKGYWISVKYGCVYSFGDNSWGLDWTNWTPALLEDFAKYCPDVVASRVLRTKGAGMWVFKESQISNGLDSFGAFGVESTVANADDVLPAPAA